MRYSRAEMGCELLTGSLEVASIPIRRAHTSWMFFNGVAGYQVPTAHTSSLNHHGFHIFRAFSENGYVWIETHIHDLATGNRIQCSALILPNIYTGVYIL